MAREISDIEASIYYGIERNPELKKIGLFSSSKIAVWRMIVQVVAFCMYSLEQLFDSHKTEVNKTLSTLKPHTMRWYREKALAFRYGHALKSESDVYKDTALTEQEIQKSTIITYAAVTEASHESRLIIKVATQAGGKLGPITLPQKAAFTAYLNEIKDAGVLITVINYLPDRLYLTLEIYYNPLELDEQGNSIISGGKPVEKALSAFLKTLPFNGMLVLAHLVDACWQVDGVEIPNLIAAERSWVDPLTGEYGKREQIAVKNQPESGYFELVDFKGITYKANV